jgi:hypothetical protein
VTTAARKAARPRRPAGSQSRRALPDAVTIAYVHETKCSMNWHHSTLELLAADIEGPQRVWRGGWLPIHSGTGGLIESRNLAAKMFLHGDPDLPDVVPTAPWLLWTDTDMGFARDALERLLAAADPVERPFMGGLCFSQREVGADGLGGYRTLASPTIFDWTEVEGKRGFAIRWNYERGKVQRCQGTGSAFVLIHRSVFERVEEAYGQTWYDRIPNPDTGQLISEDLSFCMRADSLGIPIHVHAGVQISHHKEVWLGEEQYARERVTIQMSANGKAPKVAPAKLASYGL